MSEADVEYMRRLFEAGNASGWDPLPDEFTHPQVRFYNPRRFPAPPVYEGDEGRVALFDQWLGQFSDFQLRVERLEGRGDSVIALLRATGVSRASGAELDWPLGAVFSDFDDGPPREIHWFMDWEETLAAAGVPSEQGA